MKKRVAYFKRGDEGMSYILQASDWSRRAVILTSIFHNEMKKEEKSKNRIKGIILFSACVLMLVMIISCFIFL